MIIRSFGPAEKEHAFYPVIFTVNVVPKARPGS